LVCRQELGIAQAATRRIQPHIAVVKRFIDDLERSCNINPDTAIDTESNLTSEVFENICQCIGLDYKNNWSTYGPFIDDMFRYRCDVAHGELYAPESKYAKEAIQFSVHAIDRFSTEIENAATMKAFIRLQAQQANAADIL
jgi:hypothetical protein